MLDDEGGTCFWGRLAPAAHALERGALPIGLADGPLLGRAVAAGEVVTWADVEIDESDSACRTRREMERRFAPTASAVLS